MEPNTTFITNSKPETLGDVERHLELIIETFYSVLAKEITSKGVECPRCLTDGLAGMRIFGQAIGYTGSFNRKVAPDCKHWPFRSSKSSTKH